MPLNPARSICASDEHTRHRMTPTRPAICIVPPRGFRLRWLEKTREVEFTRSTNPRGFVSGSILSLNRGKVLNFTLSSLWEILKQTLRGPGVRYRQDTKYQPVMHRSDSKPWSQKVVARVWRVKVIVGI